MTRFATKHLPAMPDAVAPDGSDVRVLLALAGGSMAHFELGPGRISMPVSHRTVEEIWFFIGGAGEMWRKQSDREETIRVESGVCVTIPLDTHFQFRSLGSTPLTAIAITMPPWPGAQEAFEVAGPWRPGSRRGTV